MTGKGARLISLCGIDGAGKTTQVGNLVSILRERGHRAVAFKARISATNSVFALSEALTGDRYAYEAVIPAEFREFTIACDILHSCQTDLLPLMSEADYVIWDRGPLCYRAYAGAYGAVNPLINRLHGLLPEPSLTLFLDVHVPEALARLRQRRSKEWKSDEAYDVLARVRAQFWRLARENYRNAIIIDGNSHKNQVKLEIMERCYAFEIL